MKYIYSEDMFWLRGLGHFSCLGGWLLGCSVGQLQRWADTNVTLAFEDAQVIPPFSMEETDDTDDRDDTDDTDDTG